MTKNFTERVIRANVLLRENGLADVAKFLVAAEKNARTAQPTGRKRGIKTKLQGRFNADLDAERVAALELRPIIVHHKQWGYLYTGNGGGQWGNEIAKAFRFDTLQDAQTRVLDVPIWASQWRHNKIQFIPKGKPLNEGTIQDEHPQ